MSRAHSLSDDIFREMNEALMYANRSVSVDTVERHANVIVLGLPRSGTTLVTQVIFENMAIGCTNNLMARFWMAPLIGCRLSQAVIGSRKGSDLRSHYGTTELPWEPHEFSRFWHDLLGVSCRGEWEYPDRSCVNWDRVRESVCALNNCAESALVHKPLELVGRYLSDFLQVLHRTVFVYVERPQMDVACSIAEARVRRGDGLEKWWSTELPDKALMGELKGKPFWIQIAAQVAGLRAMYEHEMRALPPARLIRVQYQDLVLNPASLLVRIRDATRAVGAEVPIIAEPNALRSSERMPDRQLTSALARGFETLSGISWPWLES